MQFPGCSYLAGITWGGLPVQQSASNLVCVPLLAGALAVHLEPLVGLGLLLPPQLVGRLPSQHGLLRWLPAASRITGWWWSEHRAANRFVQVKPCKPNKQKCTHPEPHLSVRCHEAFVVVVVVLLQVSLCRDSIESRPHLWLFLLASPPLDLIWLVSFMSCKLSFQGLPVGLLSSLTRLIDYAYCACDRNRNVKIPKGNPI